MAVKIEVKNKQGQTRMIDPIDLKRWAKKGYVPEKSKPVTETKPQKKDEK